MNLKRIGLVARREFVTTVTRKGFLIGLLVMPVLTLVLVMVMPRLVMSRAPQVQGEVLVIDRTGAVTGELRQRLDPDAVAERRADARRRVVSRAGPALERATERVPAGPPVPRLTLREPPGGADLEAARAMLAGARGPGDPLALVVIQADAVERGPSGYGSYELYVAPRLDDNSENVLHESLRLALVAARMKASGLDAAAVEMAMRVARPAPVVIGDDGQERTGRGFNRLLPFILGILLFVGVMTGGQTLMTSTIEEKSSRVVEVLLSAVSPLELMWGKLLGQLGVGLLTLVVYVVLGVLMLLQFAMFGLLDPMLILWLFVFFLLSYLVYGTMMLVIGSAVSQPADAQSLMGPVMILLIAPYVMAPMIGQAPDSAFSVAISFIPPFNSFAMLARLASSSPPPVWQVLLTVAVGLVTAAATVWFAAKVFRIGLLMQGKPPGFGTLVRWARMA